jgi:hypothetical protein
VGVHMRVVLWLGSSAWSARDTCSDGITSAACFRGGGKQVEEFLDAARDAAAFRRRAAPELGCFAPHAPPSTASYVPLLRQIAGGARLSRALTRVPSVAAALARLFSVGMPPVVARGRLGPVS